VQLHSLHAGQTSEEILVLLEGDEVAQPAVVHRLDMACSRDGGCCRVRRTRALTQSGEFIDGGRAEVCESVGHGEHTHLVGRGEAGQTHVREVERELAHMTRCPST